MQSLLSRCQKEERKGRVRTRAKRKEEHVRKVVKVGVREIEKGRKGGNDKAIGIL